MMTHSRMRVIGRRMMLLLVVPIVIPIVIWMSVQSDTESAISDRITATVGPFAVITDFKAAAKAYRSSEGKIRWAVEYDLTGTRSVECLGGLDARRTLYDDDGVQIAHVVTLSPSPRTGVGEATFVTVEIPLLLGQHEGVVTGRSYQLQVEVWCLDEMARPRGLSARSPRVWFTVEE